MQRPELLRNDKSLNTFSDLYAPDFGGASESFASFGHSSIDELPPELSNSPYQSDDHMNPLGMLGDPHGDFSALYHDFREISSTGPGLFDPDAVIGLSFEGFSHGHSPDSNEECYASSDEQHEHEHERQPRIVEEPRSLRYSKRVLQEPIESPDSSVSEYGVNSPHWGPAYEEPRQRFRAKTQATDENGKKVQVCPLCNRVFSRDLARHMRTHEPTARFICPYPRELCPHKRGQFHRQYDFRNHLLHWHFEFSQRTGIKQRSLAQKFKLMGRCKCNTVEEMDATKWFYEHVMSNPPQCPLLKGRTRQVVLREAQDRAKSKDSPEDENYK